LGEQLLQPGCDVLGRYPAVDIFQDTQPAGESFRFQIRLRPRPRQGVHVLIH
jgi:hypothetical protein